MVFHVFSHINLFGNDRADTLANEGRRKSHLYANALPGQRPTKRLRPNPPDVADVELVLSSDEELELRYINARRPSLHLPPQPQRLPPVRGMTPPPPKVPDWILAETVPQSQTRHKISRRRRACLPTVLILAWP